MKISTKNGTSEEEKIAATLKYVLKKYDCPEFTDVVVIEEGVIPHSHPVLTLNTREKEPISILNTYVHEQFHWFAVNNSLYKDCIEFLKKYPDLGDCDKSGKYPDSFWEHLIVCWNTRNFLTKTLTKKDVDNVYSQWQPYPITEMFVKDNFEDLEKDLKKFNAAYLSS